MDKFHDECGLMGIWNHREAANLTYLGLYSQQHRGQEGAGVVALNPLSKTSKYSIHKGIGLVADVFQDFSFSSLPGKHAIGHVRYTTAGGHRLANVQPLFAEVSCGELAVCHNGNLVNAEKLKRELIDAGAIFSSSSDTEVFLHLLARTERHEVLTERVIAALKKIQGAYSMLMLFEDRLIAVRDPHGFRPLVIGTLDGSTVVASETCAFDLIGAETLREVEPGELVEITGDGEIKSFFPFGMVKESPCIFEHVYFSRPDSNVFGKNVYEVRKRMGEQLAKEFPVEADLVVPVPDSGVTSAVGYSQVSSIELEMGLIRNHYVGRTFIEPKQSIRDFGVKLKLNANAGVLSGKRIVVVDDSIVRGTTSRKIVAMLRAAGAKEVHFRISSPKITDPCYYGIDTPDKDQLLASKMSVEEMKDFIGVDTLGFLSIEGLFSAVQSAQGKYCDACFTGNYPTATPVQIGARKQQSLLGEG